MAVVLGLATAASAATLTVVSDKATYNPGETITLTISGDDEGATQVYSTYGRLTWTAGQVTAGDLGTQVLPGPGWVESPRVSGPDFLEAIAAADFSFSGVAPAYPAVINVVTLIAGGPAGVTINWADSLSFFGILGAQPAVSFTIVPEPTTAALLGLGLLGLVVGGRRRS
jgi:hypothetical protein